jgi:hypothetical protein
MQRQSIVPPEVHQEFVAMLPTIERIARFWFRNTSRGEQLREDVADVVGLCWKAFLRCRANGNRRFTASTLAHYACRQLKSGRTLHGCADRSVTGRKARARGWRQITPFGAFDEQSGRCCRRRKPGTEDHGNAAHHLGVGLEDFIDYRANPADIVAFRLDVPAWLETLSPALRLTVAVIVEYGPVTSCRTLARLLGISPARFSQRRRELYVSWQRFNA